MLILWLTRLGISGIFKYMEILNSKNWSDRVRQNHQTQKAYSNYTNNPTFCEICEACMWPWPVKGGIVQARMKKCCSYVCSSKKGALVLGNVIGRPKSEGGYYRKICPTCGRLMTWQATTCKSCSGIKREKQKIHRMRTLGELKKLYPSPGWRTRVSRIARDTYKASGKPYACEICGYENSVDIAHISAVSNFEDNCTLAEVNDIKNLIALCPNHHWEFDKGVLNK